MTTENVITIIVALIAAIFGSTGFWTWLQDRTKRKKTQAKLLMGIAYNEIIIRAEHYIERGCITATQYNELNRYLYEPYKEMGGNGTAEALMEQVRDLPIEPDHSKEAHHD